MNANSPQPPAPDDSTVAAVFAAHRTDAISSVTRFPTGLRHYVYEVRTTGGNAFVVRIAVPATRATLAGGLYWHPRLTAAGVPVPALLASGVAPMTTPT